MNLSTIRILDRLRNIKTKSVLAEHRRWKSIKKGEGHFNTESLDKIRLAAIVPIRLSRNDPFRKFLSIISFVRLLSLTAIIDSSNKYHRLTENGCQYLTQSDLLNQKISRCERKNLMQDKLESVAVEWIEYCAECYCLQSLAHLSSGWWKHIRFLYGAKKGSSSLVYV